MAQCSASEQLWPWSHAPGHFIRSEFLCTHGPKLYIPKASPPREEGLDLLQIREEKKASPCWINSPKNGYPNQGLGTSLVNPFEGITSLSIQVTSSLDLGSGLQVLSLVNHTAVRRQSGSVYDCLRNGDGIKKIRENGTRSLRPPSPNYVLPLNRKALLETPPSRTSRSNCVQYVLYSHLPDLPLERSRPQGNHHRRSGNLKTNISRDHQAYALFTL